MSLNAATIEVLLAKGLTGDDLLMVARAMEVRKPDPTNAARQARHRMNRGRNAVTVTALSPNDISSNPEKELPQDANASLPQGAKTNDAVPWPCPTGVEPGHWRDFLANRKRKRAAKTQTALDGQMKSLADLADDEWPPGRLVQHAAAKGWASICDPRKPLNGTNYGSANQHNPGIGKSAAAAVRAFGPPERWADQTF